jgi:hypothetical protein
MALATPLSVMSGHIRALLEVGDSLERTAVTGTEDEFSVETVTTLLSSSSFGKEGGEKLEHNAGGSLYGETICPFNAARAW